mmetsp:Transcript_18982/g.35387  ORF Transcript_18982/g.35387 Transcript_18982/m.35387 type:complete len:628 (+) Transcript_18982:229-2112(+)
MKGNTHTRGEDRDADVTTTQASTNTELLKGESYEAKVIAVKQSSIKCQINELLVDNSTLQGGLTGVIQGVRFNVQENRSFRIGDVVTVILLEVEPCVVLAIDKVFIKPLLIFDVHGVLGERMPFQQHSKTPRRFITRPHCEEFLKFCFQHFEVAVWSSALLKNVTLTMFDMEGKKTCPLFVWSQNKITDMSPIMSFRKATKPLYLKELRVLWNQYPSYDSSNSLLLDDDLEKCARNPYGSLLFIPTFDCGPKHEEDTVFCLDSPLASHLRAMVTPLVLSETVSSSDDTSDETDTQATVTPAKLSSSRTNLSDYVANRGGTESFFPLASQLQTLRDRIDEQQSLQLMQQQQREHHQEPWSREERLRNTAQQANWWHDSRQPGNYPEWRHGSGGRRQCDNNNRQYNNYNPDHNDYIPHNYNYPMDSYPDGYSVQRRNYSESNRHGDRYNRQNYSRLEDQWTFDHRNSNSNGRNNLDRRQSHWQSTHPHSPHNGGTPYQEYYGNRNVQMNQDWPQYPHREGWSGEFRGDWRPPPPPPLARPEHYHHDTSNCFRRGGYRGDCSHNLLYDGQRGYENDHFADSHRDTDRRNSHGPSRSRSRSRDRSAEQGCGQSRGGVSSRRKGEGKHTRFA